MTSTTAEAAVRSIRRFARILDAGRRYRIRPPALPDAAGAAQFAMDLTVQPWTGNTANADFVEAPIDMNIQRRRRCSRLKSGVATHRHLSFLDVGRRSGFGSAPARSSPGQYVFDPVGALYKRPRRDQERALDQAAAQRHGRAGRIHGFRVSRATCCEIASGGDADAGQGQTVGDGFGFTDGQRWELLGPFIGAPITLADYLSGQQMPVEDISAALVRTIALSCGTRFNVDRRRPSYGYFTNQDQQARFPGDTFCERTPLYAHGFQMPWPKF
jgi:hypothetical protein